MRIRDWSSDVCSSDLVPNQYITPAMPSRKPKSPTRLTRNALRFANTAVGRLNQKPISRYDTSPTASQPKNSCRKLLDITSISIENVNRLRTEEHTSELQSLMRNSYADC